MKKVKVQLTYEWEFSEREWSLEQKHIEELKNDPKSVLGYDILHTFFYLNDITHPEITKYTVDEV